MKTSVVDLLAKLDRWFAELDKVRFSCDGEAARRLRGEIVIRAIMVGVAVETHVLSPNTFPAMTTLDMKNGSAAFSIIDQFDDILDMIYPTASLFPLTKQKNLASSLEPNLENSTIIYECMTQIASDMKEAIASAPGADIPGLFYERHMVTGKNRKGIVYTPVEVCKIVVKRALEADLDRLIERASDGVARRDKTAVIDAINQLAAFSVLDPACGTGPFLVEALRLLGTARERMESITGTGVPGSLASQVHGIDEDPLAVEIARFNVSFSVLNATRDSNGNNRDELSRQVKKNIAVGDAITSLAFQDLGVRFNAVVGNPPYVNYKKYLGHIDRAFLERNYRVFDGQADLSYYFFELHARLLKEGGMSGQVSSRYFMQASHARHLREFLVGYEIVEIVDMNDWDIFGGVGIHSLLFFFKNCRAPPDHQLVYRNLPCIRSVGVDFDTLGAVIEGALAKRVMQSRLEAGGWCMLSGQELAIQAKFDAHPSLGDLGDVLGGAETGHDEAFAKHVVMEHDKPFGIHDGKKYPLDRVLVHPWLKNGDIRQYFHNLNHWCIYVPPDMEEAALEARYPETFAFLSCFRAGLEGRDNGKIQVAWYSWRRPRNVKNLDVYEKIVLPYKASWPRASIDGARTYCSYDVTVFIPRKQKPSLAYITGVLNSAPTAWYFATFGKRMGGIYEFYSGPVGKIRIPVPDPAAEATVRSLVEEAVVLARRTHDTSTRGDTNEQTIRRMEAIQGEIDKIVLNLVGLNQEERAIVLAKKEG